MSRLLSAQPGSRSLLRNASGVPHRTLNASLAALQKYRRAAPHVTLGCVVAAADRAVGDGLHSILDAAGYAVERADNVDYALARLKPEETLLAMLTLRLPSPGGGAPWHEVQLVLVLPVAPAIAAEQAALADGVEADRTQPSEIAALLGLRPDLPCPPVEASAR